MGQYDVKGYEGNPGYDGPYHPSAELDPDIKFVHAGDPEAAGKLEEEAYNKAKELHDERKKKDKESLESWEIEQGKTAVVRESSDYPDVAAPRKYEPPIETEGVSFSEKVKQDAELRSVDNDATARSSSSSGSNSGSSGSSGSSTPVKKAVAKKTAAKKATSAK